MLTKLFFFPLSFFWEVHNKFLQKQKQLNSFPPPHALTISHQTRQNPHAQVSNPPHLLQLIPSLTDNWAPPPVNFKKAVYIPIAPVDPSNVCNLFSNLFNFLFCEPKTPKSLSFTGLHPHFCLFIYFNFSSLRSDPLSKP